MKMQSTPQTASKQTADRNQVLCLLGKMLKIAFTFIHLVVLLFGFSIICLGVLCISTTSSTCGFGNNELVFYCLLPLGFFLLVTGIFCGTFHEVLKYKGPSRLFIQNVSHRELHINIIDKLAFYPLSYEDSTDPEKQTFPLSVASTSKQQEVIKIPPPLYSESSTEFISETHEWEQPPPYELSVWQLQQQQTAVQDSSPGKESISHPPTQENSHKQDPDCHGPSERLAPVRTSETSDKSFICEGGKIGRRCMSVIPSSIQLRRKLPRRSIDHFCIPVELEEYTI